jgi:poly(A) polymerase
MEEDARRRDFSVNALYYSCRDFSVIDYVDGMADLNQGVLRVIGKPDIRYREDPVRMLRAVRFAAKLGFRIDTGSAEPIRELAPLLLDVPPARLFEEVLKMFHGGNALGTYELLRHYGLFQFLFPLTEQSLAQQEEGFPMTLLPRALANTDKRVSEDKPVSPAFLFAALLWEPVRLGVKERMERNESVNVALQYAADQILRKQSQHILIPKRFSMPMKEIWSMQNRFERRTGKQAWRWLHHPRFRAAYDFLLLRAECGEAPQDFADWWTRFEQTDDDERQAMVNALPQVKGARRRRHRRPKKRPAMSEER